MIYTDQQRREHITELQRMLRVIGVDRGEVSPVIVDGVFTPEMAEAIRQYQRRQGLDVTGLGDQATWESIAREARDIRAGNTAPEQVDAFPFREFTIGRGATGGMVYVLQAMLNAIALHFDNLVQEPCSGTFDQTTEQNIRTLQAAAGLPVTGVLNRETWDVIGRLFNVYSKLPPMRANEEE